MKWLPLVAALSILAACSPSSSLQSSISTRWSPFNRGLPTHSIILALAVDPRDSQKIFAGAYDSTGVYLSTDRARTWRAFGDGLDRAAALALQFVGDQLYAGTINGLFRLPGERWMPVNAIPATSVYSIAPGKDGQVYIATDRRGIFSSADGGKNWSRVPGLDGEIILSVAALDSEILFAGTSGHGAFVTRNRGQSWRTLDPFSAEYVSLLAIDPRDRRSIFLRTRDGLYRTSDEGATWLVIHEGLQNEIVNALLFDSQQIYAATNNGVFESDADGRSWKKVNEGIPANVETLSLTKLDANTILAGAQNGIYVTRDAGKTWQAANEGLGVPRVNDLAIDPQSGTLIAATEDGLYQSDENGAFHWIGSEPMHWQMVSVAIAPSNPQIIYAGSYRRGIYISRDGGKSWERAGDIFRGRLAAMGLAVDPENDDTVFTRVIFERIYKSTDGGDSWHAVWTGMTEETEVETIAIAPSDPTRMYAGTNTGIYFSMNRGESWMARGLESRTVFAVWIDPRDPRALLAGATDGMYRSGDAGETWLPTSLARMTITAIARDAHGNFFAGTKYNGIWMSRDDAKTWERFGAGLDEASVVALAVDDARGILYAATTRGIFKLPISDFQFSISR